MLPWNGRAETILKGQSPNQLNGLNTGMWFRKYERNLFDFNSQSCMWYEVDFQNLILENTYREEEEVSQRRIQMWYLYTIFLLLSISQTETVTLPPAKFIKDFAVSHQLTNIVLHSNDDLSTPLSVKWWASLMGCVSKRDVVISAL